MFDVIFFNFAKRRNAFSVPTLSAGVTYSCKLKAPTTLLAPTIELSYPTQSQSSIRATNYAYIADFGRYYYIKNWVLDGTLIRASLEVDALASHRTAVLASTQYVLRSASNYNGFIKDTKYPILSGSPTITGWQNPNPLQPAPQSYGVFVLGIIQKACTFGSVQYVAMSYLVLLDFMNKLFDLVTQWNDGGADLADGLKKAITDPMQYIVSCTWFPYSVNDFVNRSIAYGTNIITVGYDNITLAANAYLYNPVLNAEFTNLIAIQDIAANPWHHPLAASRGDYMNREPYSRYYFSFYPFCSLCEIDSMKVKSPLYIVYTVDLRTGKGICSLCPDFTGSTWEDWRPLTPIRTFEAQVGVQVPLATIHTEIPSFGEYLTNFIVSAAEHFGGFKQFGQAISATVADAIGGSDIPPAGTSAYKAYERAQAIGFEKPAPITLGDLSSIATEAAAMKSTPELIGSQGTISFNNRMPIMFWGEFYNVAPDNLALYGRPLCQSVVLNTLSGFVMCDNPRVTLAGAFDAEIAIIENALATGAFI